MVSKKIVTITTAVVGALLIISTATLLGCIPGIVRGKINDALKLQNGSDFYKRWSQPPVDYEFNVYLFNITNKPKDGKINHTWRPNVKEVGPFKFRLHKEKINLEFSDDNKFVTYEENRTFFYEGSKELYNQTISHVNFAAMAIHGLVMDSKGDVKQFDSDKTLFMNHTVEELIFKGFNYRNTKYAYFIKKNGTTSGKIKVKTGFDSIENILQTQQWNGNNDTSQFWPGGPPCSDIKGTDGTQFKPGLSLKDNLYIFNTELMRSIFFTHHSSNPVKNIPAETFTLPREIFEMKSQENSCFCLRQNIFGLFNSSCDYDGLLDLSGSQLYGFAPLFASAPHFYQSSLQLLSFVDGLNPNEKLHRTYLSIEQKTGTVVDGAKRMMFSIKFQSDNISELFGDLPPLYLPLFWVEEKGTISDDLANQLNSKLDQPKNLRIFSIICIIIGFGTILGAGFYHLKKR